MCASGFYLSFDHAYLKNSEILPFLQMVEPNLKLCSPHNYKFTFFLTINKKDKVVVEIGKSGVRFMSWYKSNSASHSKRYRSRIISSTVRNNKKIPTENWLHSHLLEIFNEQPTHVFHSPIILTNLNLGNVHKSSLCVYDCVFIDLNIDEITINFTVVWTSSTFTYSISFWKV